jgi:methylated-DNA-[protein]-cysteine S-methyltransferase
MTDTPFFYTFMDSPIGRLLLAGDEAALHFLSFPNGHKSFGPKAGWIRSDAPFAGVTSQLTAYFEGHLRKFDVPLAVRGTDFQKRVWRTLPTIPFGETRSYGWLARQLGAPNSSRAVGAANGANPLPIILPCHRVVGADGSLTGFGGGIETKRFLLDLEAHGLE